MNRYVVRLFATVFAAVIFVALPGYADAPPARELAAGKAHEVCYTLIAGQELGYAYTASGPLAFNIHYHEGAAVHYLERRYRAAEAAGKVALPADREYCLMWRNKRENAVTLDFSVTVDGRDVSSVDAADHAAGEK